MVNLYHLTNHLIELMEETETLDREQPEADTDSWLAKVQESLSEQLEEKLDACASVVQQLSADEAALKVEMDRFRNRMASVKAHRERLKSYMVNQILTLVEPDAKGRRRVKSDLFLTYIQRNPMSVDQDGCDLLELPGEFVEYTPKIKSRDILASIKKDGVIPNGVVLKEERWGVRIR